MMINKARFFLNIYLFHRYIVKAVKIIFYSVLSATIVDFFFLGTYRFSYLFYGTLEKYFADPLSYLHSLTMESPLLTILIAAVLILIPRFIAGILFEKSFKEWSAQHNWIYDDSSKKRERILKEYHFINRLSKGENRYALNCIQGTWDEIEAEAFNFHYQNRASLFSQSLGKDNGCYIGLGVNYSHSSSTRLPEIRNYYFGVVVLKLNLKSNFSLSSPHSPLIKIRNKKITDDFSRLNLFKNDRNIHIYKNKIVIESDHAKFKDSFCNNRLMQYLLVLQEKMPVDFEVFENHLVFYKNRSKMNCYEVESFLNVLNKINKMGVKNTYLSYFKYL